MSRILPVNVSLLCCFLLAGCEDSGDHPPGAQLLDQWRNHHTELEELVTMFRNDDGLNRVASDFTRPDNTAAIGVTSARLAKYRRLLQKSGVKNGIEGYAEKDAIMFHVSSLALAVSGSGKGFAYCEGQPETLVPDLDAYVKQALADHAESFTAYQRIEGSWYLYYDYED